jgi:hypothetical protein
LIVVHLHISDRHIGAIFGTIDEESTARSQTAAAASVSTRSSLSYAIMERQVLNGDITLSNKKSRIVGVTANDRTCSIDRNRIRSVEIQ